MMESVRIKVTGRVQHVGFRYFTAVEAGKLKIKGFVKNEPDGSVLIEAEGEEDNIELFNQAIKHGPSWSRVDRFLVQSIPAVNYARFSVK